MTDTLRTKLGTTRAGERTRIWLQGSRLQDYGFPAGSCFRKKWHEDRLVITQLTQEDYEGGEIPRAERGRVSGNDARPVIDITGENVATMFKGSHVVAAFIKGRITITEG